MRLAISNIAWDTNEDFAVAKLLDRFAIDAIDVAPGKYFSDFVNTNDEEITKVARWWADHGIEIIGMQSLMFGKAELNVFGDTYIQEAMLKHLRAVCQIGAGLGARRLVFGAPKSRDRSGLNDAQTLDQAVAFFRRLGDTAKENGVIVCLEPNPTQYGANFMTTSEETAQVVEATEHVSIQMQFDTGALTINEESPKFVLESWGKLIGHVHASEPDLVSLGDGKTNHRLMCQMLEQYIPDHVVSIEMVATKHEPHLQSVERALACAVACYRNIPE